MIAFLLALSGFGAPAQPVTPFQIAQADARQAAAIRKACAVGALPASQCRGVTGAGQSTGAFPSPAGSGAGGAFPLSSGGGQRGEVFQDPQGRYRVNIPDGWNTSADNGSVSFSGAGTSVQVLTTSGNDIRAVLQQVSNSYRQGFSKFQAVNQGPTTLGGHPSFGMTIQAADKRGQPMAVMLLAESAGSGHYLVLVASGPPSSQSLASIMQLANSVRFHGE